MERIRWLMHPFPPSNCSGKFIQENNTCNPHENNEINPNNGVYPIRRIRKGRELEYDTVNRKRCFKSHENDRCHRKNEGDDSPCRWFRREDDADLQHQGGENSGVQRGIPEIGHDTGCVRAWSKLQIGTQEILADALITSLEDNKVQHSSPANEEETCKVKQVNRLTTALASCQCDQHDEKH